MSLSVVVALLGLFLCYREWYHSVELAKLEDRYFKERKELLDRLMSRDFAQYKQAEILSKPINLGQNTPEFFDYDKVGN